MLQVLWTMTLQTPPPADQLGDSLQEAASLQLQDIKDTIPSKSISAVQGTATSRPGLCLLAPTFGQDNGQASRLTSSP